MKHRYVYNPKKSERKLSLIARLAIAAIVMMLGILGYLIMLIKVR